MAYPLEGASRNLGYQRPFYGRNNYNAYGDDLGYGNPPFGDGVYTGTRDMAPRIGDYGDYRTGRVTPSSYSDWRSRR